MSEKHQSLPWWVQTFDEESGAKCPVFDLFFDEEGSDAFNYITNFTLVAFYTSWMTLCSFTLASWTKRCEKILYVIAEIYFLCKFLHLRMVKTVFLQHECVESEKASLNKWSQILRKLLLATFVQRFCSSWSKNRSRYDAYGIQMV